MTHAEYCNNRMAWQNASVHISSTSLRKYSLNGRTYTEEEFKATFPITGKIQSAGQKKKGKVNIDSTTNWMN